MNMISIIVLSKWIRKRKMTKLISLNAKINEITEADEMKSEYQKIANVKIKEIVTSINIIVDNEKNEWESDVIDNNWKKWARKTNTRRRCASSMSM